VARRVGLGLLVALVLAAVAGFRERSMLLARLQAALAAPPALSAPGDEGAGVAWFDDYYTVEHIDEGTIAIGEPRYHQANYSYLILGSERAILFDSGPGVRDIRPVVESLTRLPVTALPSHLHFDHVGNHRRFERVALVDLPYLREQVQGGVFTPTDAQHLGFVEGFEPPPLRVTDWLAPGSEIDLGGRALALVHVPGHTHDSVALLDAGRRQLFTGDYVYEGELYAFLPGASLRDYLATAESLLPRLDEDVRLLTGHRATPPGAPLLRHRDLVDLRDALRGIRDGSLAGEGWYPRVYPVNEELVLLADPWPDL
jgi:glyoxylase-like metal-dependent hydrolase (beta-lactamase superfamily II)